MTRKEYTDLIEQQIKDVLGHPDAGHNFAKWTRRLAERIAMMIWNPEEVARAAKELARDTGISFEEAVEGLAKFVKAVDNVGAEENSGAAS